MQRAVTPGKELDQEALPTRARMYGNSLVMVDDFCYMHLVERHMPICHGAGSGKVQGKGERRRLARGRPIPPLGLVGLSNGPLRNRHRFQVHTTRSPLTVTCYSHKKYSTVMSFWHQCSFHCTFRPKLLGQLDAFTSEINTSRGSCWCPGWPSDGACR